MKHERFHKPISELRRSFAIIHRDRRSGRVGTQDALSAMIRCRERLHTLLINSGNYNARESRMYKLMSYFNKSISFIENKC